MSKTVTSDGDTQIDTSELLRTYGQLHPDEEESDPEARERQRVAVLEERNRSLERVLALEAELRKVKDQVTSELRARLADKETVIKALESKLLFLEYDKHIEAEQQPPRKTAEQAMPRKGWWARFLKKR